MLVLFIAVGAVLVFAAIVASLATAWAAERDFLRRIGFNPAAQPFAAIGLLEAFDPEYAVLWTTQLEPLRLINAGGVRGVTYSRVYGVYLRSANVYPELYDGSSFAEGLFFVQRAGLVVLAPQRVKITREGRVLLEHVWRTAVAA